MKLQILFAVLMPILVTVQAGCYGGLTGIGWPDRYGAHAFVDQICNSGGVSGYFNQGQTKYRCHQPGSAVKQEFWVGWRGRGGLTLNDVDCKLRLKNEIEGCGFGGESTVADWYFR